MSLLTVGTVAFDAIETPFGKTDKIVGGAATYIAWSASYFSKKVNNSIATENNSILITEKGLYIII